MFGSLKRPEDVQNEFVAVERGKSPTNPDYMQCLFLVVLFSRKSYMNGNHWQTGRMEVVTFFTCFLGLWCSLPEAVFLSVSSIPL